MTDPSAAMDGAESVILTICREGDGSYRIYPGDEPDETAAPADMSEDDADALGPAGAAPAPDGGGMGGPMPGGGGGGNGGQPATSIGQALKIAMDILQADKSNGAGGAGDADAQFAAGYGSDKAPTPAGLKYPPA